MNLSLKKIFSTSALLSLIAIFILSCSGNHLICDSQYRETTEKAFNQRKHLAINRDTALFSVFDQKLSLKQSEALKFLYAYMPLSDLADYNGNFFLANADMSLRSKSETGWEKIYLRKFSSIMFFHAGVLCFPQGADVVKNPHLPLQR